MQPQIHYPAVLVSALAKFVFGAVWYTVFGNQWMELTGITEEMAAESNMAVVFGGSFLAYVVQAYVLAHFVHYTSATSAKGGAQTGFWLWLGISAVLLFQGVLYEMRPMMLWVIDAGYELISLILICVILAVWKKKPAAQA
jgi:hypothetical protein